MNKVRCGRGLKSNNNITIQLFMALSAREKYQTCQARKYCTVAILAALTLQLSLQKQTEQKAKIQQTMCNLLKLHN